MVLAWWIRLVISLDFAQTMLHLSRYDWEKKILLNCLHNISTYFLSGELWEGNAFTRVCHSVHSGV